MSSFTKLLSRLTSLNEAKDSPMDRIMPGFQGQARALAKSRGASSGTREGRLAMLGILFDMEIIDDNVVRMFKNDPSVSRMVDYFETNGIAKQIKNKRDEIQAHIKDQLENKVSFTTGNRTDAAQQRYEVNKLNTELKAAKKVARLERKKETGSAMSQVSQVVDEILGSYEQSFSEDYMMEVIVGKDSDLNDISNILKYLSKYVDEEDVEVDGRNIDVVFKQSSKLGRIIDKVGLEDVQKEITRDLKTYSNVVEIKISLPDMDSKEDMIGNLRASFKEDEEGYEEVGEEDAETPNAGFEGLVEDYTDTDINQEVKKAQLQALKAVEGDAITEGTSIYLQEVNLKRLAKGAGIAMGLAGATIGGAKVAQNLAKPVGSAISRTVSDITAGGNEAFLERIKDPEDYKRVAAKIEALRSDSVSTRMSRQTDQYIQTDDELRDLEDEMRTKYDIPNNIYLREDVEIGTGAYLTEQTKKDSVRAPRDQQSISFKEKFKPKTSYQLDELRRYGL
jgi:hypothetical protein